MNQPRDIDPDGEGALDDEALAIAARTDPAAFAVLYERYRPSIHGFVYRRLGDPHRAEDVTSQVFLLALKGLPTYRSGSFRGWLFRIARNAVTDSYRRERPATSDDTLVDQADPQPGPLELLETREARERFHATLGGLTDTQQRIVRLRLRGLTGQEIADELGIGLGAVKSAQFRAFDRIRNLMDTSPEPPPTTDRRRNQRRFRRQEHD